MTAKLEPENLTDPRDEYGLTERERAFCDRYCDLVQDGAKNPKSTAAEMAGYSPVNAGPQASRLLKRPHVRSYIAEQMSEGAMSLKIDRSFILFEALTLYRECRASNDYRYATRQLEIMAKHVDVKALVGDRDNPPPPGTGLSLPFDLAKMSTDDKIALLAILERAGAGSEQPTG